MVIVLIETGSDEPACEQICDRSLAELLLIRKIPVDVHNPPTESLLHIDRAFARSL